MLPGLRFLALATVMVTSVLIFGLGAAALLLASHDRLIVMASRNLPHAPLLMARPVVERPVLSLLRVEPPLPREPAEMISPKTPVEEARVEAAEVAVATPPPQERETPIVASVSPAPTQDTLTREDVLPAPAAPMGPLVTHPAWMAEEPALAVVSEFSPKPGADVQDHANAPDAAPSSPPAVIASAGEAAPSPDVTSGAAEAAVTENGNASDVVEETMAALIDNPPLPRSRPDFDLLERQRQEAARRARVAERRQRAAKLAASRQAEAMRVQAERNAAPPFGVPSGFGQGNAGGFGQFPQQQVAPPR